MNIMTCHSNGKRNFVQSSSFASPTRNLAHIPFDAVARMVAISISVTALQGGYNAFPVGRVTPTAAVPIAIPNGKRTIFWTSVQQQFFLFSREL